MENDLYEIISHGIFAPSADNNQPWRFVVKGNQIEVFFEKNKQSIKDFSNKLGIVDLISIGALIENIKISASHFGYQAKIEYNKNFKDALVAKITFNESVQKTHSLHHFIAKRATNRKEYEKNREIGKLIKNTIKDIAQKNGGEVQFIESKKALKDITKAVSYFDEILWGNAKKRADLLKSIRWTEEEAVKKQDGIAINSLGFKKTEEKAMVALAKVAQKLPSVFNLIKISAKRNSKKLIKNSSGLFILTMDSAGKQDYIAGGQLLERIWLNLTAQGIQCHPMSGALFSLLYDFFPEGRKELSKKEVRLIHKIAREIGKHSKIPRNRALIALLRVGYANPVTHKKIRRPVSKHSLAQ